MKLLLLLLALAGGVNAAEVGSPEWIVRMFFEAKAFPEKSTYYVGEMKRHLDTPTIGESNPDSAIVEYRVLNQNDSVAMFAVAFAPDSETINFYCYLRRQGDRWQLEAIRSLALPEFFFMLLLECDRAQTRTRQEELQCRNVRLVASSDAELKQYLKDHLAQFEKLVSSFEAHPSLSNVRGMAEYPDGDNSPYSIERSVAGLVDDLALNAVMRRDGDRAAIDFNIGGIMDNSVGFLYLPANATPPTMNQSHYIYVEKVLPRWYIYKTT